MAFSIRYETKRAVGSGKAAVYPLGAPSSPMIQGPGHPPPPPLNSHIWAPIPSTSSHHHQSGGGGQGCQCRSLRREESWGFGHLPSSFTGMGENHSFPGGPGANISFCLLLHPEAHENCLVSECAERGQILKTVIFISPTKEGAEGLDSWVPEQGRCLWHNPIVD